MSKLSVKAPAFIPEQYSGPIGGGDPTQGQPLPKYMTNCYPFVNADNMHRSRWNNPGKTQGQYNKHRSSHSPHSGGYQYSMPGPHGYQARQMYAPGAISIMSPPQAPVYPTVNAPPGYGIQNPYYQYQPVINSPVPSPVNLGTTTWGAAPNISIPYQDYGQSYQSYPSPGQYYTPSEAGGSVESWSGSEKRVKVRIRKKVDSPTNMKSVGIQNECGVQSKGKKPKTKTIILMDVAIQTDFSDEIANLTLAEQPNALYKKKVRRQRKSAKNQVDNTSTDSDEVDSDSGYSSPMHRRNQISNGTHPIGLNLVPSHAPSPLTLGEAGLVVSENYISNQNMSSQYNDGTGYKQYGLGTVYPPVTMGNYDNYTAPSPLNSSSSSIRNIKNASEFTNEIVGSSKVGVKTVMSEPEPASAKHKRRRNRRKKKPGDIVSDDALHRVLSTSNVSDPLSLEMSDSSLHFEDTEEFPDLLPEVSPRPVVGAIKVLSYSQILKSSATQNKGFRTPPALSQEPRSSQELNYSVGATGMKEGKNSRKRRKRRDMANRAAEDEMAEIIIEQHMIKEGIKQAPVTQPNVKKSKQQVTLNLADMICALEKKPDKKMEKPVIRPHLVESAPCNDLDSTAPATKRGKEREVPKQKKPSSLKKVILKEREEKKKLRILDGADESAVASMGLGMCMESDLSQEAPSSKASSMDIGTVSNDLSPISQTSPIIMSPISPGGSPLSSGVNSPVANQAAKQHLLRIHSRRFREYCTQVLDKEIDSTCTLLLQGLVHFQDRLYHKDPTKAKSKRRIVLGLREVTKHLRLKKIKCVVISPNLERIQSKGGLDDALNTIIDLCQEQDIPFVFALGRRALGRACAKLVPVSVCGIFNYEGAEEQFKKMMDQTEKARNAYNDMISILETEAAENKAQQDGGPTTSSYPQFMAHMGHSRTPSGCSAISFTSSILSEPMSESLSCSNGETDLRQMLKRDEINGAMERAVDRVKREGGHSRGNSLDKITIIESIHEIDEGHEADIEDANENLSASTPVSGSSSQHSISSPTTKQHKPTDLPPTPTSPPSKPSVSPNHREQSEERKGSLSDELHHIDSIHCSALDLNAEILSQHSSSKTLDLTIDTVSSSNQSVKTVEGVSTPPPEPETQPTEQQPDLGSVSQKLKLINKERIESWVAETQEQMEQLSIDEGISHDNEATWDSRESDDLK